MRHHKADKKLGRESSHRQAMLRNMVTSFFRYDRIETTDAKAKVLRPIVEKMITLARKGDLHSRRQALSYFEDKNVVHKLFDETTKKLKDRQSGGYTHIIKKTNRKGDNAPVSVIKLLIADSEVEKKPKKKTKATETKKETQPKTVKKTTGKEKKPTVKKPKKVKASEKEDKKDDQDKE
jgi:large subunit ribosomal protein L17